MKIQATHNPPAHDDLRLQESEPYCDLARAIIKRAYRDSIGLIGHEHALTDKTRAESIRNVRSGIAFMCGRGFKHWCDLLGADPDDMLRMIEARESEKGN